MNNKTAEAALLEDVFGDALPEEFAESVISDTVRASRARRQRNQIGTAMLILLSALTVLMQMSPTKPDQIVETPPNKIETPPPSYETITTRHDLIIAVQTKEGFVEVISTEDHQLKVPNISDQELLQLFAHRSPRIEINAQGQKMLIFSN